MGGGGKEEEEEEREGGEDRVARAGEDYPALSRNALFGWANAAPLIPTVRCNVLLSSIHSSLVGLIALA